MFALWRDLGMILWSRAGKCVYVDFFDFFFLA